MSEKKEQEKIKKIRELILKSGLPLRAEALELSNRTRFRLEETRFFLGKMESNLRNRIEFRFYLDAFLASARSIFHVFEKEFHDNGLLMDWYKGEIEVKKNPVVKFFINLRNISLKEHTPDTYTSVRIKWAADVNLTEKDVKRVVDSDGKEHWVTPSMPLEVIDTKIIGYSFVHNFKWFNENPDVISLCKEYLDELERFVTEAENQVKEKRE